ncbi:MAG: VOC family protein [Flavisolibacter sp.]|nr:VOC family protein [Flavisolibacter sp.]MBD0374807.1 VOC family protein [Flavisolibacter sp.]
MFLKTAFAIGLALMVLVAHAQVKKVDAITITVKDMSRSLPFYRDVLGFKVVKESEVYGDVYEKEQGLFGVRAKIVRMQLGDEYIELMDYLTSGGRSIPEDVKSNDLIFQHIAIVVSDMDKAYQHLRGYNVEHVSTGPQTIPPTNTAAAGVKAFYFHDPDGHNLELIYFPNGKGQPKWQNGNGKLFLGIDHTAIGISDTEKSLTFYQQLLGIEKKGESWNNGTEQEHLNFIEGASLHITGLRAAEGPGIEFLQYVKPGPGKKYPADSKPDDLWHWQTSLFVSDAEKLYDALKKNNTVFISKELVDMKTADHQHYKTFVIRDPDGHALRIIETVKG